MGDPVSKASEGDQIDIVKGMEDFTRVNSSRGLERKCSFE
jgi:hypothetical protein